MSGSEDFVESVVVQYLPKVFNGEAYDVGEGFFVVFDNEFTVFLDRISAGFVQCVDFGEVVVDSGVIQGFELYLAGDGLGEVEVTFLVEEGDGGENSVGFSRKLSEHFPGLGHVGGLVENGVSEGDGGVGAQNQSVRVFGGDGFCLQMGIDFDKVLWAQAVPMFLDFRGEDAEFPAICSKEFTTSGRTGGKDEFCRKGHSGEWRVGSGEWEASREDDFLWIGLGGPIGGSGGSLRRKLGAFFANLTP